VGGNAVTLSTLYDLSPTFPTLDTTGIVAAHSSLFGKCSLLPV
jgi:hypothetical protein